METTPNKLIEKLTAPTVRDWLLTRLRNGGDLVTFADLESEDWERLMGEYASSLVAAERERCAKIAEGEMVSADSEWAEDYVRYNNACKDVAAAIREAKLERKENEA
jgi:hypothetical protein